MVGQTSQSVLLQSTNFSLLNLECRDAFVAAFLFSFLRNLRNLRNLRIALPYSRFTISDLRLFRLSAVCRLLFAVRRSSLRIQSACAVVPVES